MRIAIVGATFALVFVLVVVPLAIIIASAFAGPSGDGALSIAAFETVLSGRHYWIALANTLGISILATLIATSIGVGLAWTVVRTNIPLAGLIEKLAIVPIFVPPFVGAFAWMLLAAPRIGIFNLAASFIGLGQPFDVYAYFGIAWVIGIYLAPYVLMIVASALRSMDPSLEEAGQVSGLSRWRTAATITLPLIAPAILSGAVLAFVITIGLFGTPVLLGWNRQIMLITSRIYLESQEIPPMYGIMAVLSLALMVLSTGAMVLQRLALRNRKFITVTGKGFRPRSIALGRSRYLLAGLCWFYIFLTMVAPVAVIILASIATYTWSGKWTLDNLEYLFTSSDVSDTMANSLITSCISATLATILGLAISWLIVRTQVRGRHILEYLVLLPVSVPGIAFGLGVLLFWLRMPIDLYGTLTIIIIAFVGRYMAYSVRSISASLVQVHPELEESARVSGLGWFDTLRLITLPLIRPSIVASWVLLYSIFITEMSMVILLNTTDNRTFTVLTFSTWFSGLVSRVAGLAILQMLVGVVVMLIVHFIGRTPSVSASRG